MQVIDLYIILPQRTASWKPDSPNLENIFSGTTAHVIKGELWYCRRYDRLAQAQGILADVQMRYADHLSRADRIMAQPPGYWRFHPLLPQSAQGEAETQGLKEVLDVSTRSGAKSSQAVRSVLQIIAAFANPNSGIVLIGVSNDLVIKGLACHMRHVTRNNLDGFLDKLRMLIADRLGPPLIGKMQVPAVPPQDIVYLEPSAPGSSYWLMLMAREDVLPTIPTVLITRQ